MGASGLGRKYRGVSAGAGAGARVTATGGAICVSAIGTALSRGGDSINGFSAVDAAVVLVRVTIGGDYCSGVDF